jgi:hypothetical protein
MEECKLCGKDSTPWFHINGHICQDCYYRDRWINVEEDLPHPHQDVLMLNENNQIEVGFIGWDNNRWYTRHVIDGWSPQVKRWMPLPSIIK